MEQTVSPAHLSRLWNQYIHAFRHYQHAKYAADQATAACQAAVNTREAAHADEVDAATAVVQASEALQAASDAAFLTQNGISAC